MYYSIDMGAMKSLLDQDTSDVGGIGSVLSDEELKEAFKALSQDPGITNLEMDEDTTKGTLSFSLDFANLDVLNDLMAGTSMMSGADDSDELTEFFKLKKNKLTYTIPEVTGTASDELLGEEGASAMYSMMTYELKLSFDQKVKKVKTKTSAVKSSGGKDVIWNPDFEKMMAGEESGTILIVLGK